MMAASTSLLVSFFPRRSVSLKMWHRRRENRSVFMAENRPLSSFVQNCLPFWSHQNPEMAEPTRSASLNLLKSTERSLR
jgi:hypothetical protein